jgi:ribosome biogenesis protein Nip4
MQTYLRNEIAKMGNTIYARPLEGIAYFKTSLKWSAHSLQGYSLEIKAIWICKQAEMLFLHGQKTSKRGSAGREKHIYVYSVEYIFVWQTNMYQYSQ